MSKYTIKIASSGTEFSARDEETVLAAAQRQGVMLPYSCKNGTCASCRGCVVEGDIHYPYHPPMGLDDDELSADQALFCQAVPKTDLTIQIREIDAIRDIPTRLLPARVAEMERLADDVIRLQLRLPKGQRLQFLAGQYVDILLAGGKRRAFSIASAPHIKDHIELHIRHVEGGGFTGFVFDELEERGILRLEGPLGTFFVSHDEPDRPRIFMAGGTGFAPLKAMVEDLEHAGDNQPIHLFWGARARKDLYINELPRQWAQHKPQFEYTTVLSHPEATDQWTGFTGFVHQAVLDEYPNLRQHDVYMSGPPAMIDAARHAFLDAGLPEERLFYDAFEFGPDVPVSVLRRHLRE